MFEKPPSILNPDFETEIPVVDKDVAEGKIINFPSPDVPAEQEGIAPIPETIEELSAEEKLTNETEDAKRNFGFEDGASSLESVMGGRSDVSVNVPETDDPLEFTGGENPQVNESLQDLGDGVQIIGEGFDLQKKPQEEELDRVVDNTGSANNIRGSEEKLPDRVVGGNQPLGDILERDQNRDDRVVDNTPSLENTREVRGSLPDRVTDNTGSANNIRGSEEKLPDRVVDNTELFKSKSGALKEREVGKVLSDQREREQQAGEEIKEMVETRREDAESWRKYKNGEGIPEEVRVRFDSIGRKRRAQQGPLDEQATSSPVEGSAEWVNAQAEASDLAQRYRDRSPASDPMTPEQTPSVERVGNIAPLTPEELQFAPTGTSPSRHPGSQAEAPQPETVQAEPSPLPRFTAEELKYAQPEHSESPLPQAETARSNPSPLPQEAPQAGTPEQTPGASEGMSFNRDQVEMMLASRLNMLNDLVGKNLEGVARLNQEFIKGVAGSPVLSRMILTASPEFLVQFRMPQEKQPEGFLERYKKAREKGWRILKGIRAIPGKTKDAIVGMFKSSLEGIRSLAFAPIEKATGLLNKLTAGREEKRQKHFRDAEARKGELSPKQQEKLALAQSKSDTARRLSDLISNNA